MRSKTVVIFAVALVIVAGLGFAQSRPVKAPPKGGGGEEGLNLPSPAYGFVPNPKDYYVEIWSGNSSQGGNSLANNPLPPPACRYVYVYGNSSNNSTTQVITATNEDAPDWAFEVTIPATQLSSCGGDILYVTWDGQADSPAQSQQNKGIAFRCEVEQSNGSTRYRVPCPGTHYFTPWVIRADSVANGEQNHTAYSGAVLLPSFVNGFLLSDVTFRFGFVVRTDGTATHRVWNQNLMLEVGSVTAFLE